jgi:hypothetical protein
LSATCLPCSSCTYLFRNTQSRCYRCEL